MTPATGSAHHPSSGGANQHFSSAITITAVESVALRIPFTPGHQSAAAVWGPSGLAAVDTILVKVSTDAGLTGWGEAFGFSAASVVRQAIDGVIAPLCVGQDCRQVAGLMNRLQRRTLVFGRGGPIMFGLSAVDIALWDIVGKAADAPLHQLLGGGPTELPAYASLDAFEKPSLVRAGVRQALDAGFQAVKLHETTLEAIHAAREEAGPRVELMVDAGCPWDVGEAQARAQAMEEFDLKWLEEPVWPPENYEGLARVRDTTGVAIAAGENVSTPLEFSRMLMAGAVDFIQPSVAKMGGVTELCKIFALAEVHNVPVFAHSFYDGPGLLAAIHATAALRNDDVMIEWRFLDLEAHVLGDALTCVDGRVPVPRGPGLGLDPDPEVIRAFRVA